MIMKWNPIIGGDLSEVPLYEDVLFTMIDEATGEDCVICDELDPTCLKDGFVVFYQNGALERTEKVIAWGEFPEPFKPGRCDMCKYRKEWINEFGEGYVKCELLRDVPFSHIISSKSCPLDGGRPW